MHSGISFTNGKECSFDSHYSVGAPQQHYAQKKSQTGRITHFITPFIWNLQKEQICRDKKQSRGCLGLGMEVCWRREECKRFN